LNKEYEWLYKKLKEPAKKTSSKKLPTLKPSGKKRRQVVDFKNIFQDPIKEL